MIDDVARRRTTAVGAPATWVLSNHDVVRHVTRYARPQPTAPCSALTTLRRPSRADLELGRGGPARPRC